MKNTANNTKMDTVIIKIKGGDRKFKINNKDWFWPEVTTRGYQDLSYTEQTDPKKYYLRHFYLKTNKRRNNYLPKVDIYEVLDREKKYVRYDLKITFSLPKLIFGNSLKEVDYFDFRRVLKALEKSLLSIGVIIADPVETISNARVDSVHFCKNILLPEDIKLQSVLSELKKVDINKVVDITQKEEKNGGKWLHIYSGNIEHVFYDKIADALRPKGKRKDKDFISYERQLIDKNNLNNKEIFRYEYRIKRIQTVQRIINKILNKKPKTTVCFKDLFTTNLPKNILIQSWGEIIDRPENQLVLFGQIDKFQLISRIIRKSKENSGPHSFNRVLIYYGLISFLKDYGVKVLKELFYKNWSSSHPERLTNKIKEARSIFSDLSFSNNIAFIDSNLRKDEKIKISSINKADI